MSPVATRWVIELGSSAGPTGHFMHVFDDGRHVWSEDLNRALRFASKQDAERHGFDHLDCAFAVRARSAEQLSPAGETVRIGSEKGGYR